MRRLRGRIGQMLAWALGLFPVWVNGSDPLVYHPYRWSIYIGRTRIAIEGSDTFSMLVFHDMTLSFPFSAPVLLGCSLLVVLLLVSTIVVAAGKLAPKSRDA